MQIDRRYFRYFDWISFGLTLLILCMGVLFVFSATHTDQTPCSVFFKKQLVGACIGMCWYFICCGVDIRRLTQWGFYAYFITLGLLCYTLVAGIIGMGAQRWLSLYFFRFQPSELIKLLLPPFVAYYFHEVALPRSVKQHMISLRECVFPLAMLGISFILILKQPDLGTALIALFSGLTLFWFIGLSRTFFLIAGFAVLCTIPVLWKCLKPYQQTRILVLFGHGDARKERYQIEQSKIAIGSGGLWGKGLMRGTQNKLDFLPEDHSDFIFSVMCEEWGFVGAIGLILLYLLLFIRLLTMIMQVPSFFLQTLGVGLVLPILFSMCINICMVTGMLPTVGIPLPLCSYGLTNLWTTLAALGMLNNISIRRFYY